MLITKRTSSNVRGHVWTCPRTSGRAPAIQRYTPIIPYLSAPCPIERGERRGERKKWVCGEVRGGVGGIRVRPDYPRAPPDLVRVCGILDSPDIWGRFGDPRWMAKSVRTVRSEHFWDFW